VTEGADVGDEAMLGFFRALGEQAGTPALDDAEAEEVLLLAKVVAHTFERRYAPLASYAAGLLIGAGTPPEERARLVGEVIAAARRLEAPDG
jgi:hypothetical protein